MTSGWADVAVLGALLLAVALLSAGIAVTTVANRELRSSAARAEYSAHAHQLSGQMADAVRITGTVRLADGSSITVQDETIGQVVAAHGPGMMVPASRSTWEEQQDPWNPLGST